MNIKLDKRDIKYLTIFSVLTLPPVVISVVFHPWLLVFMLVFLIEIYIHSIVSTTLAKVLSVIAISAIFLPIAALILSNSDLEATLVAIIVISFMPSLVVSFFVYYLIDETVDAAINERKYSQHSANFPHLLCEAHQTRTVTAQNLSYKTIKCRVGKKCLSNKSIIFPVKNVVGVIGKRFENYSENENYYIQILDTETEYVDVADYDIIEAYCNTQNPDLDINSAFQRIYFHLYNNLRIVKPIHEIKIKIYGSDGVTRATRNFLKDKFLSVEYL